MIKSLYHCSANSRSLSHFYANFASLKSPCLTREFINDRLYNSKGGYFCKDDIQIGELSSPINFSEMIGYEDYTKTLSEKYPKNAWLTPSELFRPWYGFTIGNYIHHAFLRAQKKSNNKKQNIKIIEVGAGAASAADSILYFFKNFEQASYATMEYKIVEISPQMCKKARAKLENEHKKLLDNNQITIVNDDFLQYSQYDESLTFIILLEVLDNMPHDRVYFSDEKKQWFYETMVEFDDDIGLTNLREKKVPINDYLIKEAVEYYIDFSKKQDFDEINKKAGFVENLIKSWYKIKDEKNVFLPTGCLRMLKNVNKYIPNHHYIMADFDMLSAKESAIQGINAPIVSKKLEKSHEKHDFKSYLVPRGEADIFFPTNFQLLKHMYKKVTNQRSKVLKTHEFMDEFAKVKWAQTRSGYNPLKEDFLNTSILVTLND